MNIIYKVIRISMAEYHWNKSLKYARYEEYEKSLEAIDKSIGYSPKTGEYNLLKGFLLCAVGDDVECEKIIIKALSLVEINPRFNVDEKKFLSNYAVKVLKIFDSKILENDLHYQSCNLDNVKQSLKEDFPVKMTDIVAGLAEQRIRSQSELGSTPGTGPN